MADRDISPDLEDELPDLPDLELDLDEDTESLLDDMPEIPF